MKNPLSGLTRRISTKNRLLLGVVTAAALSTGTLMATAPRHDPTAVEEKAWPVSTMMPQVQTLSPQLALYGRVESPHHAHLSAAVEAHVATLHVAEGEQVQAGQLLISLDDADQQLLLAQAEAALMEAQADLDSLARELESDRAVLAHMQELYELTEARATRLRKLAGKNLVATEQLEDTLRDVARQGIELARQQARVDQQPQQQQRVAAAVDRARAERDTRQLAVTRTRITAPFNGRIADLAVAPGDRVERGRVLVEMFDTGALQVRVAIPADSVAQFKAAVAAGRAVNARLDHSEATWPLRQLAAAVARGRSGLDALFEIPAGSDSPELGRAVALRIDLPARDDLVAVPVQSVYDNARIYAVNGERLQAIEVTPAGQRLAIDGSVEILLPAADLPQGKALLASDLPVASDGLRVAVLPGRSEG